MFAKFFRRALPLIIAAALVIALCATLLVACDEKGGGKDGNIRLVGDSTVNLVVGDEYQFAYPTVYTFSPSVPSDTSVSIVIQYENPTLYGEEPPAGGAHVVTVNGNTVTAVNEGVAYLSLTSNANGSAVALDIFVSHKHILRLEEGHAPTCFLDGWRDSYVCTKEGCWKRFHDEQGKQPFTDEEQENFDEVMRLPAGHVYENGRCTRCNSPVPNPELMYRPYSEYDGVYEVYGGNNIAESVIAIKREKGFEVQSIGEGAFEGNTTVTEVFIPEGVKKIQANAFKGCTSLRKIHLPDDVDFIGESAFAGCAQLEAINFPKYLYSCPRNAFVGCVGLQKVEYDCQTYSLTLTAENPDENSLKLFNDSLNISEVVLGDSVTSFVQMNELFSDQLHSIQTLRFEGTIAQWCNVSLDGDGKIRMFEKRFVDGQELNGALVIPEGVQRINGYVFWGSEITSLVLPDGLESISARAFQDCPALTSVTFNRDLVFIENDAFSGCTSLYIPKLEIDATYLHSRAFKGCSIQEVVLRNINYLSDRVFEDCRISKVTLGTSLVHVSGFAFGVVDELHFEGTISQWCNICVNDGSYLSDPIFNEVKNFYVDGNDQPITQLVIPADVTALSPFVFSNFKGIQSVTIPATVQYIGQEAFSGCDAVTDISLPIADFIDADGHYNMSNEYLDQILPNNIEVARNVTVIDGNLDSDAISYYYNINILVIGEGVDSVGNLGLTYINQIVVRSSAIENVKGAIQGVSGGLALDLETLVIGREANGVNISDWTALQTLTFEGGLTSVGIIDNVNLETLTFPSTVTSITNIINCPNLTTVQFPDNFSIRGITFANCPNYQGERYIGDLVDDHFYVNDGVIVGTKDLGIFAVIPNDAGITAIDENAFKDATSLRYVYIFNNITRSVPENAFASNVTVFNQSTSGYTGHNCTYYANAGYSGGCTADGWIYNIENGKVTIVAYIGEGGEVTVPAQIEEKPVTQMNSLSYSGSKAISLFLERTDITKLTFTAEVVAADDDIVKNMSELQTIVLAATVKQFTIVGDSVGYTMYCPFAGCNKLAQIVLEGGNENYKFNGQAITSAEGLAAKFKAFPQAAILANGYTPQQ